VTVQRFGVWGFALRASDFALQDDPTSRVQSSEVQSSEVQGSEVQGLVVQGSKVQDSEVQDSKVQRLMIPYKV
jgi:helix-turn-helix protein